LAIPPHSLLWGILADLVNKAGGTSPALFFYSGVTIPPRTAFNTSGIILSTSSLTQIPLSILRSPRHHIETVCDFLGPESTGKQTQDNDLSLGELLNLSLVLKQRARYYRTYYPPAACNLVDNRTNVQRVSITPWHVSPRPCLQDAVDLARVQFSHNQHGRTLAQLTHHIEHTLKSLVVVSYHTFAGAAIPETPGLKQKKLHITILSPLPP
jgi:hypothetical protein